MRRTACWSRCRAGAVQQRGGIRRGGGKSLDSRRNVSTSDDPRHDKKRHTKFYVGVGLSGVDDPATCKSYQIELSNVWG